MQTISYKPTQAALEPPRTGLPKFSDPRIVFAILLTLYAVLGCTVLGFNRNPVQILLTVVAGCGLEVLFHRVLKKQWIFPLSAYISSISLSLLLNYAHNYWLLFFPTFFCIASKYLFTFKSRHVINPSLFGVVMALTLGQGLFASAPAYQWGGSPAMAVLIVTAAISLFIRKVGRNPLILSFLFFYTLNLIIRAHLMQWHVPWQLIVVGTLTSPSFYLFTFYMLTDPKTSPSKTKEQIKWSFSVAAIDLVLHAIQALSTLFYSLFLVSLIRLIWLHCSAYKKEALPLRPSKAWLLRLAALTTIAYAGLFAYKTWIVKTVSLEEPGFRFRQISGAESGIDSRLSSVLGEIDPRIRHIAKWLLSIGDAVAVGDYNNDGRLDIFLTNPLKRAENRNALYENLGGYKFRRVDIPCLREISEHPEIYGLTGGALFVDYDNSGNQSLLLSTLYGKCRLLKNLGRGKFVDVSEAAGVDVHSISATATCFDYDRDGKLDFLVGNGFAPYLKDYAKPTPFTVFKLPEPEYPGDRRMFHFMHHGWQNSENGGEKVLFHNEGSGRFSRISSKQSGMPETHWTLATATADLNHDGYTDVYCASDFGPDDLYLNQGGKKFVRVSGKTFGSIGRDTYKGMNVSIADLDNRGEQDIYVSNSHAPLQAEGSLLWKPTFNKHHPFVPDFEDEATSRGCLNERRFGWGAAMGDLNLDGALDMVQANGMVDDTPDKRFDTGHDYWYNVAYLMLSGPELHSYADMWPDLRGYQILGKQANRVYLSRGNERSMQFVDVAEKVGLTQLTNSRGVALADFDNRGVLDMAITHQFAPLSLYKNTLNEESAKNGTPHHWLGLDMRGDGEKINRDAIGTQVFIRYQNGKKAVRQMREVRIENGFSAQSDRRLLFGLGDYQGPVDVTIQWYGAESTTLHNMSIDGYHKLTYLPGEKLRVIER